MHTLSEPKSICLKSECPMPLCSAFHPKTLKEWSPASYNAPFNCVKSPFKKKNDRVTLSLMGCFSQKTSNQPSQGNCNLNSFTFIDWDLVDLYVHFAGSASEGIIVPPPPYWIRVAHKNGVKIFGTIFFPPIVYGGKIEWVNELINPDMLCADKLIELADFYGFDGWFVNQETGGGNATTGKNMQQFLEYIQNNSSLEMIWYDAMIENGSISYQNDLNSINESFFQISKQKLTNYFFTNFGWGTSNLIISSRTAKALNRSPNEVYSSINVATDGVGSLTRIKMIYNFGQPYTSIGLFGAQSASENFWQMMAHFKTVSLLNSQKSTTTNMLKTASPAKSFITNFNTGKGHAYFINGRQVSSCDWWDVGQQDYLPVMRKLSKDVDFNYDDAFEGGSCLKIVVKNPVTLLLFDTNCRCKKISVTVKYLQKYANMWLVIKYSDNSKTQYKIGSSQTLDMWKKYQYIVNISKIVTQVLIKTKTKMAVSGTILLGQISLQSSKHAPRNPKMLKVIDKYINGSNMSVNISWKYDPNIWYHYIYQINKKVKFIGRTSNNIYHVNLTKVGNEKSVILSVKSISHTNTMCNKDAHTTILW